MKSTTGGGRLEVLLLRILWLPSSYPEEQEWDPAQPGQPKPKHEKKEKHLEKMLKNMIN
jgi:hypothetical protein